MSFEEFHLHNPQYSFLVAKIHYNLLMEKQTKESALTNLVINFTVNENEACESCSA